MCDKNNHYRTALAVGWPSGSINQVKLTILILILIFVAQHRLSHLKCVIGRAFQKTIKKSVIGEMCQRSLML